MIVILLIIINQVKADECSFSVQKNTLATLKNFDAFNELSFEHCQNLSFESLQIIPNNKIILDDSLNFTNLQVISKYNVFNFILIKLKGIELNAVHPFTKLSIELKGDLSYKVYILDYSNFEFYFNKKLVNHQCNQNLKASHKNFLSDLYLLDAASPNVIFREKTCPLVFFNARISYLFVSSTDSFFARNILSFSNISDTVGSNLDSKIAALDLRLYHANLDYKILNKYIFKHLLLVTLNGIVNSIEDDIFMSFKYLKMFHLRVQNIRNLFQKRNQWLQYLNNDVDTSYLRHDFNKIFTLVIEQTHYNVSFYTFPDEDLCYFKDFPHQKFVMPIFKPMPAAPINVSCLYLFLIQYSNNYVNEIIYNMKMEADTKYTLFYYYDELNTIFYFKTVGKHCANYIQESLSKCNLQKLDLNAGNSYFYVFDWQILIKYNQIIFSLFIIPLFCLICFAINVLTIVILSEKEVEDTKIYLNLKINSYFILGYIFLSFFKLLFVCTNKSYWNDAHFEIEYCLSHFRTDMARYFNVIFLRVFNLLKCILCFIYNKQICHCYRYKKSFT